MEASTLWMGLLLGSLGMAYFVYGKKQDRAAFMICGALLMIGPYFLRGFWPNLLLGAVLAPLPFTLKS